MANPLPATNSRPKRPGFFARLKAELDRRLNLRYWSYRRKVEPRTIGAFLEVRKNLKTETRFSIVVPCYGITTVYVIELIVSLEAQTYREWELCICDDGDPDAAVWYYFVELKKTWGDRLKLVRHERNQGIGAATRTAIGLATGDFVVFVDADDVLHRQTLQLLAARLAEAPDCDFIYSDHDFMTDWSWRIAPMRKPAWSPELLLNVNYINHLTAMRRSLLTAEDDYFSDEMSGAQDMDLCLKMISRARRVSHLPFILYHWRARPGSVAAGANAKPWAYEAFKKAQAAYLATLDLGLTMAPALVFANEAAKPSFARVFLSSGERTGAQLVQELLQGLKSTAAQVVELADGVADPAVETRLVPYAVLPGVGAVYPFARPGMRMAYTPSRNRESGEMIVVPGRRSAFSNFTGNILAGPLFGLVTRTEILNAACEALLTNTAFCETYLNKESFGACLSLQMLKLGFRNVSADGAYREMPKAEVHIPRSLYSALDPYI